MPVPSPRTLIDEQGSLALAHDGFAVLELLSAADIERLLRAFGRHAGHHRGAFSASLLIADATVRARVHQAVDAVLAPALAPVLASYRTVFCGFAVKEPCQAGGEMPLHQDISFSRPEGRPSLSVWTPLVEVSAANGCMRVVPGSHRCNSWARAPGSPPATHGAAPFERAGLVRELPMRPGQALVMDQRLLHDSPGNHSGRVRVAATAVAVPGEERLRYYHRSSLDGLARLEAFEVPEDFFLNHPLGGRPERGTSLGMAAEQVDPIHPSAMA